MEARVGAGDLDVRLTAVERCAGRGGSGAKENEPFVLTRRTPRKPRKAATQKRSRTQRSLRGCDVERKAGAEKAPSALERTRNQPNLREAVGGGARKKEANTPSRDREDWRRDGPLRGRRMS